MKFITPILKNLMSSKRRTILTVLSIAVSLFIFSALISLPTAVNQVLSDTASSVRLATHNKAGGTYPIPQAYKQRIATTPHVVAVVPQSWFGGIYHEVNDQFPNSAIDPERIHRDDRRRNRAGGRGLRHRDGDGRGPWLLDHRHRFA